jgi:hypothetical protein
MRIPTPLTHSTRPQEHRSARQESDSNDRQSQAHPVVRRCQEWAAWDELIAYTTGVDARQGNRSGDTGSRDDEGEAEQNASFHPSRIGREGEANDDWGLGPPGRVFQLDPSGQPRGTPCRPTGGM